MTRPLRAPGSVFVAKGREGGLRAGRPWVYGTEIERAEGEFEPGDVVRVSDWRGRFLGWGYCNPRSVIAVRILSRDEGEDIGEQFFKRRIADAWRYRCRVFQGDAERLLACRVVFGEADFLPALIVDRFGGVLVIQTLALGIDRWKEAIITALKDIFAPEVIYERNDAPVRDKEGLPLRTGPLWGEYHHHPVISEHGVLFAVDVINGQKTGHFLDQADNRAALRPFCKGARVLDAFCHNGGFGLHAAVYGAQEVVMMDISADAVRQAEANARLNGVLDRMRFRQGNAFDELRRLEKEGERFDLVVLDPPAFTKSRAAVEGAYRGYKEINLRAMKLLPPGGILVTCSCSYHMPEEIFLRCIHEAAVDAGRFLRVIQRRGAAPDHPVLLGAPETAYLKCYIIEVR